MSAQSSEQFNLSIDDVTAITRHRKLRQFARLSVDLYHSDKELKKGFAKWLKESRQRKSVKQPLITPKKIQQWRRNSVLPYSDLILWSWWSKNTLEDEDIGILILPESKLDTDNFLKDTRKDFSIVMTYLMLDRLTKQATSA